MSLVRQQFPGRLHAVTTSSWLLVVALAVCVLLAPALVAASVTAPEQPVSFARSPWLGWAFLGDVVTGASGAQAASPGAALRIAQSRFERSEGLVPTRARLAFVPGDRSMRFEALTEAGPAPASIAPNDSLVWIIDGRRGGSAEGVVSIVGYERGDSVYDVRDSDALAALDERASGADDPDSAVTTLEATRPAAPPVRASKEGTP